MIARARPDLAIVGTHIRTMDPRRPFASAVAARDGIIIGVGSDVEIRDLCHVRTEVLDGHTFVLVPGLIDSHHHSLSAAAFTAGADLSQVQSRDELLSALAAEGDRVGPDGWIEGWGLDYGVFGDSPISDRIFDEVVGNRPALIRIMDMHTAVASQRALELAKVTEPVRFADGSEIIFRDGAPTGELAEISAIEFVAAAAPRPGAEERQARCLRVLRECSSLGITQTHQMDGDAESLRLAEELEASGRLPLRLIIALWHKPGTSPEVRQEQLALLARHGRLWRGGVAKFFADGVIDNGTAWLVEPDTRGGSLEVFWPSVSAYEDAVRCFSDAGFQCVTHATGDGAVRGALDAYKRCGAAAGVRHRIEHIETLQDSDLPRFAAEGVVASMQPLHMQWRHDDGSDWWTEMLGPDRAARAWRCGDLVATGAIVPFGSDWPVASFDPRVGMAWARLRREPGTERPPFEPEQRVSGLQALAGYTTMAASAVGEESIAGRIAEGFRADLTGFAEDPVDCPADDLVSLPVRLTIVDGKVMHQDL